MRGADANKGVDVLAEGGGEVRIRRRQDAVSAIWANFDTSGLPLATVSNRMELKKLRKIII